jgi:hypothetical protein
MRAAASSMLSRSLAVQQRGHKRQHRLRLRSPQLLLLPLRRPLVALVFLRQRQAGANPLGDAALHVYAWGARAGAGGATLAGRRARERAMPQARGNPACTVTGHQRPQPLLLLVSRVQLLRAHR